MAKPLLVYLYSKLLLTGSRFLAGCVLLLMCLHVSVFAEGSKEISANGGNRAFLISSPGSNPSYPFPTLGTMKVYARVGEVIYVGSSAQGFGSGTINLRAPDGATYTSGSSVAAGKIFNRAGCRIENLNPVIISIGK